MNANHTPLENFIYESPIKDLKALCVLLKKKNEPIGYPTLVNINRGYKLENLRKRVRGKFGAQIEKGSNGRLYFPNRPVNESAEYWVKKVKSDLKLDIEIIETQPCDKKYCNVFFKILTEPKKIKYFPTESNKKKLAKVFKTTPDKIYEDRSQSKD